jgi:hypothetical protein
MQPCLLTEWHYAVWGYWQHDTTQPGLLTAWHYTAWATDSMTLCSLIYWLHDTTHPGLLTAWQYAVWATDSMRLHSLGYWENDNMQCGATDSMTLHSLVYWHYTIQPGLMTAKETTTASFSCNNWQGLNMEFHVNLYCKHWYTDSTIRNI